MRVELRRQRPLLYVHIYAVCLSFIRAHTHTYMQINWWKRRKRLCNANAQRERSKLLHVCVWMCLYDDDLTICRKYDVEIDIFIAIKHCMMWSLVKCRNTIAHHIITNTIVTTTIIHMSYINYKPMPSAHTHTHKYMKHTQMHINHTLVSVRNADISVNTYVCRRLHIHACMYARTQPKIG